MSISQGLDDGTILRTLKLAGACLLFFMPAVLWVLINAAGLVEYEGTREEFQHTTTVIALVSTGLFLLVGIPFVLPAVWYRRLSDRALLTRGKRLRGKVTKLDPGERTTIQVEIEEEDGNRYLTNPVAAQVPGDLLGKLHEGMRVPLRVDPGDRYHFSIDWEALRITSIKPE
jgi:hypothetical protein